MNRSNSESSNSHSLAFRWVAFSRCSRLAFLTPTSDILRNWAASLVVKDWGGVVISSLNFSRASILLIKSWKTFSGNMITGVGCMIVVDLGRFRFVFCEFRRFHKAR